jgi:hypothetical protein
MRKLQKPKPRSKAVQRLNVYAGNPVEGRVPTKEVAIVEIER